MLNLKAYQVLKNGVTTQVLTKRTVDFKNHANILTMNRKWRLKGIYILIFGLFFISKNTAQNMPRNTKGIAIYAMPLAIISRQFPHFRIGEEYFSKNNFSYSLDLGLGTQALYDFRNKNNTKTSNFIFYRIEPEIKWYAPGGKIIRDNVYFAISFFYISSIKSFQNSLYYPLRSFGRRVNFDSADQVFTKKGFFFKMGRKIISKNTHLFMEPYIGFGFARRNRFYHNIKSPVEFTFMPNAEWGLFGIREEEKDDSVGQFSLGLKMGYIFWKK